MALVSKSIPSLFNGVSQQPATLRNDTQAELQENYYPTIAAGLRKRPPLSYLACLSRAVIENAAVHIINRDSTERYVVFARNVGLEAYSLLDGTPRVINFPSGIDYLSSANPATDFGFVTVADYTFILNRSKVITQGSASAVNPINQAYFAVLLAEPNITYSLTVNGQSTSTLTGSSPDSTSIAGTLASQLQTVVGSGYSINVVSGTAIIQAVKLDGTAITLTAIGDGYANTATLDLNKSVSSYSKLPSKGVTNWTVAISGDPTGGTSTYYVRWDGGAYVETAKPGVANTINSSTMPWQLIRQSDGTFTFAPVNWASRSVGDDTSNPPASFIGRTIADIYYYRGRLGFLADENVCLSRSGEYFNFWAKTATAVLDTDPIDTNVGTNKVSILRFAVPFDKSLLLFSDQTQFQLTGGQELLTPKTAKADVATEFDSGTDARPVGIGQAVYFGVAQGSHTGLREYFVDATTLTTNATDITAHVPTYLPSNLYQLASSSTEDVLFCLCKDEPSSVYVYKFFWSGNTKAQSAWLKFTFAADTRIIGADFLNNRCYFIVNRADGTYLETMDLQDDLSDLGLGFTANLDHKVAVTGVYLPGIDATNFTLPYVFDASTHTMVAGSAFTGKVGKVLDFINPVPYIAQVQGRWDAGPVVFGQDYTARYIFSEQYVKDQNGVAQTGGKLKLRRFHIDYTKTGYFRVEVQPKQRDTYTYPFTGKTLGTPSATLGQPGINAGTFSFPVLTSNEGVRIEVINDSYLPSYFQSASWEGEFVIFGRRTT